MTEHYTTLGCKSSDTLEVIKAKYRILVRKFHPDVNPDDRSAEERFKKISEAWDWVRLNHKKAAKATATKSTTQNSNWKDPNSNNPDKRWGKVDPPKNTTFNFEEAFRWFDAEMMEDLLKHRRSGRGPSERSREDAQRSRSYVGGVDWGAGSYGDFQAEESTSYKTGHWTLHDLIQALAGEGFNINANPTAQRKFGSDPKIRRIVDAFKRSQVPNEFGPFYARENLLEFFWEAMLPGKLLGSMGVMICPACQGRFARDQLFDVVTHCEFCTEGFIPSPHQEANLWDRMLLNKHAMRVVYGLDQLDSGSRMMMGFRDCRVCKGEGCIECAGTGVSIMDGDALPSYTFLETPDHYQQIAGTLGTISKGYKSRNTAHQKRLSFMQVMTMIDKTGVPYISACIKKGQL